MSLFYDILRSNYMFHILKITGILNCPFFNEIWLLSFWFNQSMASNGVGYFVHSQQTQEQLPWLGVTLSIVTLSTTSCSPRLSHFLSFKQPSRFPLSFPHWISDDNHSPCSQTGSKCNLCYCPHRGRSTFSHDFLGCIEYISSSQDQPPAGEDPTAPAAPERLAGFWNRGICSFWWWCWHCTTECMLMLTPVHVLVNNV